MAIARVNGVDLYHEVTGEGTPLVWSHEFGGDHRSWEPQVRFFARRHRIVTYNHRGYPPSSVPKAAADYSQDLLVEDFYQLLRHLELGAVHLGGCSMGANVARDLAIAHPEMTVATASPPRVLEPCAGPPHEALAVRPFGPREQMTGVGEAGRLP
jgi:pimeloyl-ACP methyl ester carboxylesterase